MCKNCSDISWHQLNLNQSKANCPKILNSDGLIVREMGPWPECIFRSLLQFLVYIRAAGGRARSARRPAVQNVFVIAQGHGVGHASPIEAAGQ